MPLWDDNTKGKMTTKLSKKTFFFLNAMPLGTGGRHPHDEKSGSSSFCVGEIEGYNQQPNLSTEGKERVQEDHGEFQSKSISSISLYFLFHIPSVYKIISVTQVHTTVSMPLNHRLLNISISNEILSIELISLFSAYI